MSAAVDDLPMDAMVMGTPEDVKPTSTATTTATEEKYEPIFSSGDRVQIVEFAPVATYRYNVVDDICTICRNDLMAPSGTKEDTEDNQATQGECGHAFHTKCINSWLQKTNGQGVCPNCNTPWNLSRNTSLDHRTFAEFLNRSRAKKH